MTRAATTARLIAALTLALAAAGCAEVQLGESRWLWLLWLVPLLLAFNLFVSRAKARALARFADAGMLERLSSGVSRPRQLLKAALILIALAACLLALAQPRWGFTWQEVKRQGVDIVVALDVSDSMLVEDAGGGGSLSRLERAKREIVDLLRLMEGDRIALIAFAGTAFVECPLTLDYGAAEIFLDAFDTDLIPVKGTDLGAALRTAVSAFDGGSQPSRAVILITDGEDHGGQALAAAQAAKQAGVRVFTIGIGRDQGSPIPDGAGGLRRDREGNLILSRLDEPTLQRIALDTGGRYVRSVTGDLDLEQIYSQGIKATLEDRELGSSRQRRWEERFQWLLAIALLALMLEPLISERARSRRTADG
jgi:Ca-activated chloride channel family protein